VPVIWAAAIEELTQIDAEHGEQSLALEELDAQAHAALTGRDGFRFLDLQRGHQLDHGGGSAELEQRSWGGDVMAKAGPSGANPDAVRRSHDATELGHESALHGAAGVAGPEAFDLPRPDRRPEEAHPPQGREARIRKRLDLGRIRVDLPEETKPLRGREAAHPGPSDSKSTELPESGHETNIPEAERAGQIEIAQFPELAERLHPG
jgi:hypothetical protein